MPTLFKRSNGFFYICYDVFGKRKWQSTGERNRTEALRKLAAFEQPHAPKQSIPSLQKFIKDFLHDAESSFSIGIQTIFKTVFRCRRSPMPEKSSSCRYRLRTETSDRDSGA